MLEWMHDRKVTCNLKRNFSKFGIEDAERFILQCQNEEKRYIEQWCRMKMNIWGQSVLSILIVRQKVQSLQ